MHPELHVGALTLPTYASIYVIAVMVTGSVCYARLRRGRGDVDPAVQGKRLVFVIACALAGTHLVSVIPSAFASAQQERLVWVGRSNFVGTLLGGTVGGLILARGDRARMAHTADLAGTPWALVLAIGRIGCWAAGCCYGRETSAACARWLPAQEGVWAMRYPTQLWSGLANLGLFLALIALERWFERVRARGATWPRGGLLFEIYLALAMLERFTLEWFRGDAYRVLGPLSWVHLLTMVVFGVVMWRMVRGLGLSSRLVTRAS